MGKTESKLDQNDIVRQISKERFKILNELNIDLSIVLFGMFNHGKSSLIKSLSAAVEGKWSNNAIPEVGHGLNPTTKSWNKFIISPFSTITVYDNRGFNRITSATLKQISRQANGFSESGDMVDFNENYSPRGMMNKFKDFFNTHNTPIDCPILVWSGKSIESLSSLSAAASCLKQTHRYILVITHADKLQENEINAGYWAPFLNSDKDDIFIVRNYSCEEEYDNGVNSNEFNNNILQLLKIVNRAIVIGQENRKNFPPKKQLI